MKDLLLTLSSCFIDSRTSDAHRDHWHKLNRHDLEIEDVWVSGSICQSLEVLHTWQGRASVLMNNGTVLEGLSDIIWPESSNDISRMFWVKFNGCIALFLLSEEMDYVKNFLYYEWPAPVNGSK